MDNKQCFAVCVCVCGLFTMLLVCLMDPNTHLPTNLGAMIPMDRRSLTSVTMNKPNGTQAEILGGNRNTPSDGHLGIKNETSTNPKEPESTISNRNRNVSNDDHPGVKNKTSINSKNPEINISNGNRNISRDGRPGMKNETSTNSKALETNISNGNNANGQATNGSVIVSRGSQAQGTSTSNGNRRISRRGDAHLNNGKVRVAGRTKLCNNKAPPRGDEEREVGSFAHLNSTHHDLDSSLPSSQRALPPPIKVEVFPNWTTEDPHDEARGVYLYSAIIAIHGVPSTGTEVHFPSFQDGKQLPTLTCCARLQNSDQIYTGGTAKLDLTREIITPTASLDNLESVGLIYRCWFPFNSQELHGGHVTLTSTSCPRNLSQYMPVYYPDIRPGEIAVCAKIAYGDGLDPKALVEWFELQRMMGVDKVQVYDMDNTEMVYKTFRHYQDIGMLDIRQYKLPGRPWGRYILKRSGNDWFERGEDKNFVVWDCRLRLAGYDYVMTIDFDEVVMPRHYTALKPFLQHEFAQFKNAASLHFKVQMFLTDWTPVDPDAPLLLLRFLNSTKLVTTSTKHVYIPSRTHMSHTHTVCPFPDYKRVFYVPTSDATLFHYRRCKHGWKFCGGQQVTDRAMLKFQFTLIPAVTAVLQQLGLNRPQHLAELKPPSGGR